MAQMSKAAAVGTAHEHWASFLRARQNAQILDHWVRGEQYELRDKFEPNEDDRWRGDVYTPKAEDLTDEYEDLARKAPIPWGGLVVTSLAQTVFVDGVRLPGVEENLKGWDTWQANRWDARQTAVHRTAIGMGTAYGVALPGKNPLTGDKMTKMLARSPKRMSAFYDDDDDEWCMFALEGVPQVNELGIHDHWLVRLYDEQVIHYLMAKGQGTSPEDWSYISFETHGLMVPPVARCVNRLDLDGRATGEIEPVLPLLRAIDQDHFDRLIVQRFGAWKVRYIAGMAKPDDKTEARLQAMKLRVEDLLVSPSEKTNFGTLEASELSPFIEATDSDLRNLAAVTQTPPHHLLGLSSNLQAEALDAAESGLRRKSADFKQNAGEFHEQMFRMVAMQEGRREEAIASNMQVRWREGSHLEFSQAALALGTAAVQLKVPVEMLWEKLPGWTDGDTERAKKLVEDGTFEQMLRDLEIDTEVEKVTKMAAAAPNEPQGATKKPGSSSGSSSK
jgi:hypothetical protein